MADPAVGGALEAIRIVLDKLYAPEHGPVELASSRYLHTHGVELPSLTSEDVAAARCAVALLRAREQTPKPAAAGNEQLAFDYTNWRGEEHRYVIEPERVEFGPYDSGGKALDGAYRWVLHGWVVTRDGDPRPDMNPRRRTFLMDGLRNIENVDASR